MKTSLFIVDDHYIVIEGIRALLLNEESIEWMGHATNAESCLSFLKLQQPEIILMDINLPDKSGIDLCKEVTGLYPSVQVIGLSTFNQQTVVHDMVENGASGYLLKNATKEEIMLALRTVQRAEIYLSEEVAAALRVPVEKKPPITRREKEVLQLIAQGYTNIEIAEQLFISTATVNTHRKSLLEKFEAKNTAILIGRANKLGIV
ncbi:MAG: response regulator transcription factor [Terrimonas ferruginea]|uniref:response regulator n=1 Tax=Terrimonas ferruginea TaxID=249 RepID=UPI00092A1B47|nr:response regulator transcription factor [Terrimonas ferruginea]MBN8783289.1 response regulator transcription factor [Terrimonas ferruginea]OJW39904.1 MAG: DNA-binding response regulator [Sphingobacteriales bacterium 48-107]